MQLHEIVRTSLAVAETRSRRAKVEHLATCLLRLSGPELAVGAAYLCGELPQGRIGLGWAAVRDVEVSANAQRAELELADVDRAFDEIAAITGKGSKRARLDALAALLRRATSEEQGFLRRLIVGELRQGALEGVLIEGVAQAAGVEAGEVRRAVMLGGDLKEVVIAALTEKNAGLARFRIELFRPLRPMLASVAESAADALTSLGEAALEWKLDGARVQVHKRGGEVRVFTRKLHDVTKAVPELVEAVSAFEAEALVLDGEGITLQPDGRPFPFQTTMRRFGRKLDVARLRSELPVTPFFFDVLHANGEDLVDRTAAERWERLVDQVPEELLVRRKVCSSADEAEDFFAGALARGHEGVVAKALDGKYAAGRRGKNWLKLKPAHTLDLIVLAAEWGSGRRQGWLSNLHLGARDPRSGAFVMLGKTFKGMTDEVLAWQTKRLQELEERREGHVVFVRPELVVEIAFDGVQTSPQYPGGVALRFARLKRYRDDKTALETDTIDTVLALAPD